MSKREWWTALYTVMKWIGFRLLSVVAIMVVGLAFVVIGLLTNPF